MNKKKIYVYGRHGKRTPFAYYEYRQHFMKYFDYVDKPEEAEYLVCGFRQDLIDNSQDIHDLLKINPSMQFVVFSEEPLWDTMWSGEFQKPQAQIKYKIGKQEFQLDYHVLNHVTSNIFEFENIPYFITTSDDYQVRYASLFLRNAKMDKKHFVKNWEDAQTRYAFYAAKRTGEQYDVSYKENTILGLNRYRSLIAEGLILENVKREGEGWGTDQKRQVLPDWHLDKLVSLDRQSFIVSALENTHLSSYVSEKIFDSFAIQATPLYYAQPSHDVFRLVEDGSFVNLAGLSTEEAIKKIETFVPNGEFIDKYQHSQQRLAELFSDAKIYLNERKRVVHETINTFSKI